MCYPQPKGTLSGNLRLPGAGGKWTRGTATDDGVAVGFDMGTKRVNWNKMGFTRLNFPEARDLSKHAGLRVQVQTDQPRSDANVSVWLREADGSWYYYSQGSH